MNNINNKLMRIFAFRAFADKQGMSYIQKLIKAHVEVENFGR